MDWFSRFGIASVWVSDRVTHFLNQTIDELCSLLGPHHHFHLAYCPWTHGAVENLNRQILAVFRALCSEFRFDFKDWPLLISIVRFALNNSVSPNTKFAPIELMTGMPPSSPLDTLWYPLESEFVTVSLPEQKVDELVATLRSTLAQMHRHTLIQRQQAHFVPIAGALPRSRTFTLAIMSCILSVSRDLNSRYNGVDPQALLIVFPLIFILLKILLHLIVLSVMLSVCASIATHH